jgi:MFS family permease
MVGIGESYLALFVLAAGYSKVAAGLVTTIPFLLGALLSLISPFGVRVMGSYKRFIVLCAAVQSASFLPLIFMSATDRIWLPAVFAAAALYWGSGMCAAAAWNTWIGLLIPARIRSHYFGRRARLCHLATIAGLAAGGLTLEFAMEGGRTLPHWYAVLFGIAGLCRLISTFFLASQTETGPAPGDHREVAPVELVRRLRHGSDGRFMLYMMLMQVGVQTAQPFFAPFIREGLQFSYIHFLTLTAAGYVARAIFQPLWGAFANRRGALRLLWIGGLGLVPLSGLWLAGAYVPGAWIFWCLLLTQLVSGVLWAAYEQAVLLMMFDHIREEERTSLWSAFSVGNASAMVGGSLIGASLLGQTTEVNAYFGTFLLSVALRLATVVYLRRAHELLEPPQTIVTEAEAVRPGAGLIERPILSTMHPPAAHPPAAVPSDPQH